MGGGAVLLAVVVVGLGRLWLSVAVSLRAHLKRKMMTSGFKTFSGFFFFFKFYFET